MTKVDVARIAGGVIITVVIVTIIGENLDVMRNRPSFVLQIGRLLAFLVLIGSGLAAYKAHYWKNNGLSNQIAYLIILIAIAGILFYLVDPNIFPISEENQLTAIKDPMRYMALFLLSYAAGSPMGYAYSIIKKHNDKVSEGHSEYIIDTAKERGTQILNALPNLFPIPTVPKNEIYVVSVDFDPGTGYAEVQLESTPFLLTEVKAEEGRPEDSIPAIKKEDDSKQIKWKYSITLVNSGNDWDLTKLDLAEIKD